MVCQAVLTTLHPTQMTLGLREVARRRAIYAVLGARTRQDYIDQRVVPCVRGPGRVLYLIDRHHMCRALLEEGVAAIRCKVICDVAALGVPEFWRFMDLRGWVHPFDREGQRCNVLAVPATLSALQDDPYRTLASFVRRASGIAKAETPFEEFVWADFLRHRIALHLVLTDFNEANAQAVVLTRSNEARHLPGWAQGHRT